MLLIGCFFLIESRLMVILLVFHLLLPARLLLSEHPVVIVLLLPEDLGVIVLLFSQDLVVVVLLLSKHPVGCDLVLFYRSLM